MSDDIAPTEEPTQPEAGPTYWTEEWQRHIERAERNLAVTPPPEFPQPEPEPEPELTPLPFDPGEHIVADVQAYVEAHPDERQTVLDAEQAGKDRVTLVDWLAEA